MSACRSKPSVPDRAESEPWITISGDRSSVVRALLILGAFGALFLWSLHRPAAVRLDFVLPDDCRSSVLKVLARRSGGLHLPEGARSIELPFSAEGVCEIEGELPFLQWHGITARYATRGAIPYVSSNPEEGRSDAIGLRRVGLKDATEAWFVIGTLGDAVLARREMDGTQAAER